ncbi:MAG TPA: biotin--[acetyl-CoA-carboxylase] ligase [Hyphomonadaceae bacterium]|nr:biotin--[acetyl-CoA-carboxylase] ligase [Hyphomonadaceae bacterium]HPN06911.1 biotin--[acetyl-CoA-carboxylase] ligase [Hyphomonadaceae bacterium]
MKLETFSSAWPVVRFDEIDSTNEEARRRASSGDIGPCWLVTEQQTAGRGRLGRQWSSPKGNLFATALLPWPGTLQEAALACFSAGLAVIDAARMLGVDGSALKLKWPNDVLAGSAKVTGILIETGNLHGQLWMAAGIGVNVEVAPERSDRVTSCLTALPGGSGATSQKMLGALDIAFRARAFQLLTEGFGPTRDAWLAHAAFMGAKVELTPVSGRIEGVMTGLAEDGALVLKLADGSETHVRAGEISVLG